MGDSDHAFESLVEAHGARLFRLAYLVLQNPADAEDAVQDALAKAWRHLGQVRSQDRLNAWLTRVLLNACRDHARQRQRSARAAAMSGTELASDDLSHRLADADQIESAMRTLSLDHREVIVLRYYADLTAKAIGEALRIPEGTVRSRLHHGLRSLRAALEAETRGSR